MTPEKERTEGRVLRREIDAMEMGKGRRGEEGGEWLSTRGGGERKESRVCWGRKRTGVREEEGFFALPSPLVSLSP